MDNRSQLQHGAAACGPLSTLRKDIHMVMRGPVGPLGCPPFVPLPVVPQYQRHSAPPAHPIRSAGQAPNLVQAQRGLPLRDKQAPQTITLSYGRRSLILLQTLLNPHNALQPESVAPLLQVTMLTNNNGFVVALVMAYIPAVTMLWNQGRVITAILMPHGA